MRALISQYLEQLIGLHNASPHTLTAYRKDLDQFCTYFPKLGVTEITHRHIREFLGSLKKTHSTTSTARKLSALRAFLRWCVEQGHLQSSPADLVDNPKLPKSLPKSLSVDEAFALCDPEHPRNKAIVELLYATGIRISELTALNIGQVDFGAGVVKVMGKGQKERLVPFHAKCGEALKAWIDSTPLPQGEREQNRPLFIGERGKRIDARVVRRMLAIHGKHVGLTGSMYPHRFRHAFATHLLESGADLRGIQEMLGHESISTTQKYTQINLDYLLKLYDSKHPHSKI